jgi:hypothetical protein
VALQPAPSFLVMRLRCVAIENCWIPGADEPSADVVRLTGRQSVSSQMRATSR